METTVESSDYVKVSWVWTSEVERVAAVVADTENIVGRAVVVVDDWVVETNSIESCVQTYYSYCNGVVKIERFDYYCSVHFASCYYLVYCCCCFDCCCFGDYSNCYCFVFGYSSFHCCEAFVAGLNSANSVDYFSDFGFGSVVVAD